MCLNLFQREFLYYLGEKVSLTVTHLHVYTYNNCSTYSLNIYDGDMEDSPLIGKYCGRQVPPPIVSRGSTLHIMLLRGGVFRATYGLLSERKLIIRNSWILSKIFAWL